MFDHEKALDYPLFQDDFGEPGDRYLQDKIVKSRKEHTCHECYSPILKGAFYRSVKAVFGGALMSYKFCDGCCEAMSREFDDDESETTPMEARWTIREQNKVTRNAV